MTKTIERIKTEDKLPESTQVVIIGGGIVGVNAALTLSEHNIPVVLIEKGHVGGEQSSRNLGWIRKTNRHAVDVPLAQLADRLWGKMAERTGRDIGYRQAGVLFAAASEKQMDQYQSWIDSVKGLDLDSRLLSHRELDKLVPQGQGTWKGGIFTPSDGYAEPHIATTAMAATAIKKGATIVQHCAVRALASSAGRICGVITEQGEVQCEQVLLAGGAWSRRFLANQGIDLPSLQLICNAIRMSAIENGPTDIAVGGPDFSFRKHINGGYVVMQRSAIEAPLTLDHLLIGYRYLSQLAEQHHAMRISLGKFFLQDLKVARHWKSDSISPFEQIRTMDPSFNSAINQEAIENLCRAWPAFRNAGVEEQWAGIIDVTPDSLPVIDHVPSQPGLTLASGFSGHGFGTGPAAGTIAAELLMGKTPTVDVSPYHWRF